MTNWTSYLSQEVYNRLCACNNRKSDIVPMVRAKWRWMREQGMDKRGYTQEDALVQILELLDCNDQTIGYDLTCEEYDDLVYEVKKL